MGSSRVKALFDTNILIEYIGGLKTAGEELERYDDLFISRIVWIEFLAGAKTPEMETQRRTFLDRFTLLEIDAPVAGQAVLLRRTSRMKLPDAIILATARVHGLLLVTRNHRDFPRREPDVRIPY
jgi:predicted nucleic acid-binding protein